jgi:hypothetical protein
VYTWEAVGDVGTPTPDIDDPSPKVRLQEVMVPVVSVLPDPSKFTVNGPAPEDGVALREALGPDPPSSPTCGVPTDAPASTGDSTPAHTVTSVTAKPQMPRRARRLRKDP